MSRLTNYGNMTEKNIKTIDVAIEMTEQSTARITGSQPWEKLADYKKRALEHAKEHVEVDGFRKGKAPLDKVEAAVGSMRLLQEAAHTLISDMYPAIVLENKLKVIGSPEISLTKLAEDNPLEFTITTAVFPEVTLADYKELAKKHNAEEITVEVKPEEVDEAIERIRSMHIKPHEHKEGEEHDHEEHKPELNDEFVKTLGDFKDVADFREKLTENIKLQKEQEAQAKKREALILEIIEGSTFDLPELLVNSEQDKMLAQMKDDVMRMGLDYDEYLKHMKKTEAELREEWKDDAKKRASSELILKEIARTEEIKPDEEKVEQQIEMIKEQYGASVPEENIRLYVESIFINEAVLTWLEEIA